MSSTLDHFSWFPRVFVLSELLILTPLPLL